MIHSIIKYSIVGAIGTFAHYAVLIILVELLFVSPVLASSNGALIGAVVNYILNYKYTFESTKPHKEALPRFFLISIAGFTLNYYLMHILSHIFNINYVIAQIITTAAVFFLNYIANRIWTFDSEIKNDRNNQ